MEKNNKEDNFFSSSMEHSGSHNDEERFVSSSMISEDLGTEFTLRPRTMSEYIGQTKIKDNLKVYIKAAKKRQEMLDHVLLYGPPGLGKTTLAAVIANELGVELRQTSGPAIEKAGDLAAILTNLNENDVLFIDEIHRLNHAVEEMLYPAMEDFAIDLPTGKGAGASIFRLTLPKFTLIGATTKVGMLTGPLRDRFGVISRLELYSASELSKIIKRSAGILDINITDDAAKEIARRSRGTPRIANRLLKRIRDFAEVEDKSEITRTIADNALDRLEIDDLGLDMVDRRILDAIINKFGGGPVGLDTLSAITGEESSTIEDVYEPYLLQLGFISRTPRGRVALPPAYKHLGITPKA